MAQTSVDPFTSSSCHGPNSSARPSSNSRRPADADCVPDPVSNPDPDDTGDSVAVDAAGALVLPLVASNENSSGEADGPFRAAERLPPALVVVDAPVGRRGAAGAGVAVATAARLAGAGRRTSFFSVALRFAVGLASWWTTAGFGSGSSAVATQ